MKVLIFDIKGRFAHFRKIYTNSSSLSYTLPPRTTVMGMIAAILGRERDTYYEEFNSQNMDIAVQKINPTRKIMQSLNYIKVTSPQQFSNPQDHTQIPFEIICGEPETRYRIYLASKRAGLYGEIKERLQSGKHVFPLYLGAAPFAGGIEFIGEAEAEKIMALEVIDINTPLSVDKIEKIAFSQLKENNVLVKDKMPVDFTKERYPINTKSYIYDDAGQSLKVELKKDVIYWQVKYYVHDAEQASNIIFY